MTWPSPFGPGAVSIAEPLASVLLAFALDDLPIPALVLPSCTDFSCESLRLEGIDGQLTVQGRSLALEVAQRLRPEAARVLNEAAVLALADGSVLTSRLTHWLSGGTAILVGKSITHTTKFVLDDWTLSSNVPAVAWLGQLPGLRFAHRNVGLSIRGERNRFRFDGLRLQGNYTWYVHGGQRDDRPPLLVLDADGKVPTSQALATDLTALTFVLGTPTRLDLLIGVDADNKPVAALGPGLGFREKAGTETHSPVPDRRDAKCWAPVLFPKVVAKLDDPEDRVFVAIAGYLDSLVDHLDGAYLKAQVALEAYCKSLLVARPKFIVKDEREWRNWLAANEIQVREHAIDEESGNTLVGKLRSAMYAPSSASVPAALALLGMNVTKDVLDEVKRRNVAAHEFVMSRTTEDRRIEEDLPRLQMVQALLGAVVAKAVGYAGPVLGWKRDEMGYRTELAWWPQLDDPQTETVYVAERLT